MYGLTGLGDCDPVADPNCTISSGLNCDPILDPMGCITDIFGPAPPASPAGSPAKSFNLSSVPPVVWGSVAAVFAIALLKKR
jgi:hypothetical protein